MAVLQSRYDRRHGNFQEGDVASQFGPTQTQSKQVSASAGLRYGRAVRRGATQDTCLVGVNGVLSESVYTDEFLGVSRTDRYRERGYYEQGDMAGIVSVGDIAVYVDGAVNAGDQAIIRVSDGRFTTVPPVGTVTGVRVVSGGTGYTSAPTAAVTGGTPERGVVLAINVTNGGSNYTVAPTVTVAGAATATAVINTQTGEVTSVIVTDNGSGYTTAPAVTFANGSGDTTGSGAAATAEISSVATITPVTVNGGQVTGATVSNAGSYSSIPTIAFTGAGNGAVMVPIVTFTRVRVQATYARGTTGPGMAVLRIALGHVRG